MKERKKIDVVSSESVFIGRFGAGRHTAELEYPWSKGKGQSL